MILVVGAACCGKTDYVKSLGWTDDQIAQGVIDDRPVVDALQDIVAADPDAASELYEQLLGKAVIICNEVGSGIIPATRTGRAAREQTGRLCNRLARQADQVVRIVAGIPQIIKG